MQLLPIIETEDFCTEMDLLLEQVGQALFLPEDGQDYLEFPLVLCNECLKEFTFFQAIAYLQLVSYIEGILVLNDLDPNDYDSVLLQNYF
jgi:hypothetical protein